jgi:glycerol uptake facilitator-like aquaporin
MAAVTAPEMTHPLSKRSVAEAIGSAFLLAAVVGSGIMADRLSGGNAALALLANALATGATLIAVIGTFGPISGSHLNPVVTLAALVDGAIDARDAAAYCAAQVAGALLGVLGAHAMFGLAMVSVSTHARGGPALAFSELIATFGLVSVIVGVGRHQPAAVPTAVGLYISGAYWFTASTSFANPAVTIARSLTDSFAGIRPVDVPGFLGAQLLGAALAVWLFRWLKE